jgi:outer membrane protein assembly factor BamE (lipoprotein component of BamABCDE complex)
MRVSVVLLACCTVTIAAGCGSTGRSTVSVSDGTIHLGRGEQIPAVLGIKAGSSARDVRSLLGAPASRERDRGQNCWWYGIDQPDTAATGIGFCMTATHRVGRVIWGVHG